MPPIQIRKTSEEPGAASLAVTVHVEQVREAEDRAVTAYQRRARLPGFRKGKAPAAIVKKHFADDIRQETLQELGDQRGKFEQGSSLAGFDRWEASHEPLNDDDAAAVTHNPSPSML